jgi:tRNA isopentenyl-2-thiomethyl-A-37 hydroxylase MiaE
VQYFVRSLIQQHGFLFQLSGAAWYQNAMFKHDPLLADHGIKQLISAKLSINYVWCIVSNSRMADKSAERFGCE